MENATILCTLMDRKSIFDALLEYGVHKPNCNYLKNQTPEIFCSCGFGRIKEYIAAERLIKGEEDGKNNR